MPTAAVGANQALTATGDSTSEGMINRSVDGKYLVFTGYNAVPGTATPSTAALARVVGRADINANTDTTTSINYAFTGNNVRAACSTDGNNIWVSGAGTGTTPGVYYTTLGSSTGTAVVSYATRNVNIYNGQLYAGSTSSSSPTVISALGTGAPTSAATATALTGLLGGNNGSTNQFVFLDLTSTVDGVDTLYVSDDTGAALRKYSLVGGTWTSNGTIGSGSDDYFGLTAAVSGNTVTLFATRLKGTSADEFVTLNDTTGYNGAFSGTPTILATAATNTAFKGLAFAPVPEPTSLGMIGIGVLSMALRRRRS